LNTSETKSPRRPYFRRDQKAGVSPPDLSKDCTFAEHIVHARGKRTRFTSVSLDLAKITDFGDADYQLERESAENDGHLLVEQEEVLTELRKVVREGEKEDRLRAARALRYAASRKEGLVRWGFDISPVLRKDLISWTRDKIQVYFTRIR